MSLRTTRFKLAACTVGAVAAATLALGTTPAAASGTYSGLAYVYGADTYTDDWGNEGVLSTSTNTNSNATCLWQKILWADGFLSSASDIDGRFGSDTKAATEDLQRYFALGVDGSVGQETFGHMDKWLYFVSGSTADGSTANLRYDGIAHDFALSRNADGNYAFTDGDGTTRLAGYNYRTCS
ncbi:peptidoglycan-binding domain-containing protein [Streptomyces europaeiscabiei]|uniref:peptidoglycan-binding domain-containing protein n=1 Tax=Streptomyces europaeiscabiei TaxID=146819 RepID=UPI0029A1C4A5|nr:peptidoglycan-binding domain-containing protein [Streptomyces europaeiscabiei]MDX3712294.1 peptidoglycan-binding domain-containing protein [Streptomyces europaeiscabiei]MDX3843790.1 peptidoglycan-binding domain-containing protein [Streptomyces europaeiscabiei]MDX3866414.1 peptidoglycan-binding domain-containing protein [Streptomyces europaeiscabiei]MDX3873026.1 peptidoglycan-binding domain-containing protein [Streptomyces europaeiscabiei]